MLEEGAVGALNAESAAQHSHLSDQENRIANTLAAVLGFPMGPHEVICPECQGGPCRQVEVCRTQAEWGPYTADLLAVQAAERLKSAEGRVKARVMRVGQMLSNRKWVKEQTELEKWLARMPASVQKALGLHPDSGPQTEH